MIQQQKQNKNKFRRIFRGGIPADLATKTKQKRVPQDTPAEFRRIQQQTQNKNKFRWTIPADPATKTNQKQVPPLIPADPATKTKQKQVPAKFRRIQQQTQNKNKFRWIIPADQATKTKQKQVPAEFRRIQQQKQNKNKCAEFFVRRFQEDKFRWIFLFRRISGGSSNKNKTKTSSAGYSGAEFRRTQQQKQNKNNFRRIFYPADIARQVPPHFLLRRNSGGSSDKNKTKTSLARSSGAEVRRIKQQQKNKNKFRRILCPADIARQVPPDFWLRRNCGGFRNKKKTKASSTGYSGGIPADPATKTKQKQDPAEIRRIQRQKQNKDKFRRIFYPAERARQLPSDFWLRRNFRGFSNKNNTKTRSGGNPADPATKTKQKQVPADPATKTKQKQVRRIFNPAFPRRQVSLNFFIPAKFRRIQRQKQNKNKFRRILYPADIARQVPPDFWLRRNSGGSNNKNKTKTSSANFSSGVSRKTNSAEFFCSGRIPADPATKTIQKQFPPNFLSSGYSKTSSAGFLITAEFRRIPQQKQNKNKFRQNSGGSSNKNKTKTSSSAYSRGVLADQATKTKQKQVPADPATKTKQKQVSRIFNPAFPRRQVSLNFFIPAKFRRIQRQKQNKNKFSQIFRSGSPTDPATKKKQKEVPAEFRRTQHQKQNKNKFRRILYRADIARQVPPDFWLRRNSGGSNNKNKTKTSSPTFLSGVSRKTNSAEFFCSGGIPDDPATKTKQKQIPPHIPGRNSGRSSDKNKTKTSSAGYSGGIPADPATNTKQKQVPLDNSGGSSNKNKSKTSSAAYSGGSSNKNETKTSSGEIPADPATNTKQKQVPLDNSGGSSNKNKTKTSSGGIPADPTTKTKQKQVRRIFCPAFPGRQVPLNFSIPADFRRIQQQKQDKNKFRRIFRGRIPADPATKTKQKQFPPDFLSSGYSKTSSAAFFITAEFRRIQRQKQNKNKFSQIFRGGSPTDQATTKKQEKFRRILCPADIARQVPPDFWLRRNCGGFRNKKKTKASSSGYSGGIPADPATKTKQKQDPAEIRRIQRQKQNKDKFRRIFYPAERARQLPSDFWLRRNFRGFSNKNNTKTRSGGNPADPATKTKQKQVPADPATKTKQKQVRRIFNPAFPRRQVSLNFFIPAKFRRIQRQKQNKNKFSQIFRSGSPTDPATKKKQKEVPAEFRRTQHQKQNKNKFRRILYPADIPARQVPPDFWLRRNSGGSNNKNKTKTSSANTGASGVSRKTNSAEFFCSGRIPADPATKTKQKQFAPNFLSGGIPGRQVPLNFSIPADPATKTRQKQVPPDIPGRNSGISSKKN
jgi:hypothetical protein